MIKTIDSGNAPSKSTILNDFSEQHQHQSIKKAPLLMPNYQCFGASKVQI